MPKQQYPDKRLPGALPVLSTKEAAGECLLNWLFVYGPPPYRARRDNHRFRMLIELAEAYGPSFEYYRLSAGMKE